MITYCIGTPLNRLVLAINHYISTGDLIGMGTATAEGPDRTSLVIPVNLGLEEDRSDFACFRSRFEELASEFDAELRFFDHRRPFDLWTLSTNNSQIERLARELRKRPGALGWGTTKRLVEAFERMAG